jgi:hypothetical protein
MRPPAQAGEVDRALGQIDSIETHFVLRRLQAVGAGAGDFDDGKLWRKPRRTRRRAERLRDRRRRNFSDRAAAVADQKRDGRRRVMVMRAGKIGIATFDAMDEAVRHQEIERAIDRDRRRPRHRFGEFVDHLIGAERPVARQQRLQDMAADRRELLRPLPAHGFGVADRVRGAAVVVVIGRGKSRLCRGHLPAFVAFCPLIPKPEAYGWSHARRAGQAST